MAYPIIQKFIIRNRSRQPLTPVGMVVHDTDTKGATDENEQAYFNNNNVGASAHAFIDWDSITETIPDNEVAWGSGPTSNIKFLQVELCVPATHDVAKFNEVWNRAIWYFANKFINKLKFNIVTKDNLLSHAEVSSRWHETDHQDPIAYFKEYGKTVDDFRAAVQNEINNIISQNLNNINVKGDLKVKTLVVYGKKQDKPLAEVLAYKIGCPVMDADVPFDYSLVERTIAVGGPGTLPWSTYIKKEDILTGKDYTETIKLVENFKL